MSSRRRRKPSRVRVNQRLLRHTTPDPDAWNGIDAVICMTGDQPSYFTDDVHTTCAGCGVNIYHRPYIPTHVRKLCIDCALRQRKKQQTS